MDKQNIKSKHLLKTMEKSLKMDTRKWKTAYKVKKKTVKNYGQITGTNGQWKMDKNSRKNMENGQLKKAV